MIGNYKSLCTEFYDLDKPNAPADAFEFYSNEILNHPQPAFEPMCGSGRFLIPLLKSGFDIEGADASKEMLDVCRRKAESADLNSVLHYNLIQELRLPQKFGLVFIPSGSIGLITDPDGIKRSINNLFKCLLPGGGMVLEILTTRNITSGKITEYREVRRKDGSLITLTTVAECDPDSAIETVRYEYKSVLNGEIESVESEVITLKYYDTAEFSAILNDAGFEKIRTFKAYTAIPAELEDKLIIFKCFKPL